MIVCSVNGLDGLKLSMLVVKIGHRRRTGDGVVGWIDGCQEPTPVTSELHHLQLVRVKERLTPALNVFQWRVKLSSPLSFL